MGWWNYGVLGHLWLWFIRYIEITVDDRIEIVSQGLSTLGSVGIVGLYVTILASLGAIVRKVVPEGWSIVNMTLSDPLPLLQIIDIMAICRDSDYP